MATTTATISLSSSDIMDNALSIASTATLTTAGTTTGITETTGLARKKIASATEVDLITAGNYDVTANKTAKVYIKNTGTATDKYALIGIGQATGTPIYLGRLYGGDWMLFPYDGGTNITVASNTADTPVLEYMVFADGIVTAAG